MKVKELIIIAILLAIVAVAVFFIVYPTGLEHVETTATKSLTRFVITSPAFKSGETIPKRCTCDGIDVSPPLKWSGFPARTKSFVLIVEDPDAPGGIFTHWIVYTSPRRSPAFRRRLRGSRGLGMGFFKG